jgi:hypothetical protein
MPLEDGKKRGQPQAAQAILKNVIAFKRTWKSKLRLC